MKKFVLFGLFVLMMVCIAIVSADQTGSIYADSYPHGAEIYLDGGDTGYVTPHKFDGLTGEHLVRVTLAPYSDQEKNVVVLVGMVSEVFLDMTESPPPIPEFPSFILPAIIIIGFLGAVLLIQKNR